MKYIALLLTLLLFSCGPQTADRYHTGESEEEIVSLLNKREFHKAAWLIESREGSVPADSKMAFLLAQAYLGKAGFEPLEFAAKVSDEQKVESEDERILFPNCSKERIKSARGLPTKCLLKRVYLHAPDADHPDFARARQLLRKAYPVPADTPEWHNTLIGLVETVSFTKRAGTLYIYALKAEGKDARSFNIADLPWIKQQGKEALREGKEALLRAEHSGDKVSRLLTGAKDNVWFERIQGAVQFSKDLGLARLLDFLRERVLKPSDEIQYGPLLDDLREVLARQE